MEGRDKEGPRSLWASHPGLLVTSQTNESPCLKQKVESVQGLIPKIMPVTLHTCHACVHLIPHSSSCTNTHMHTPTKLPAFKVYTLFCYIIHSEMINTFKLFSTPITSPTCVIGPHTYSLSTLYRRNSCIINKLGYLMCTSSHRTVVFLCPGPLE